MITQGAKANLNGKAFEDMMTTLFQTHRFEVTTEAEMNRRTEPLPDRYVIKNAKYKTIYEEGGRTEFVIVDGERRIRVEAKFQMSQGSVDEKFPYMLLNGIYAYPENEVIFVVDGDGYKPGARVWLQRQIDNDWLEYREHGKDIKLMRLIEFVNWFNAEF